MLKKILNILAVACLFAPAVASAELFKASETVLSNGLQVVVIENHKAPIVKQMIWYKVGAIDEDYGKGGSAHLLEHLMFRGSKHLKDGEFNHIMNENGVDSNAFTSHDETAYHEFADISRLEALMAMEADRMQNLNFDEKAFKTERKIVYQERKQVVENNPASPFAEKLDLMFWGNSPYAHPVTGLADEIKSLKYQDEVDFYQKYYVPNNAILVISGDINPLLAFKLAKKYFGAIPPKEVKKKPIIPVTDAFRQTLQMHLPKISTTKMVHKYLLPHYSDMKGTLYDYILLAEYLSGSTTSELYRQLVIEQKIAVSVSADFSFVNRGQSMFSISLLPAEGVTAQQAEDALKIALDNSIKTLTKEKLRKLKHKLTADLIYANDNPESAAYMVGSMLANGFTLDEVQNYENGIKSVMADGVRGAYNQVFNKSSSVYGVLEPEEKK